jgi:hypothetical protein
VKNGAGRQAAGEGKKNSSKNKSLALRYKKFSAGEKEFLLRPPFSF